MGPYKFKKPRDVELRANVADESFASFRGCATHFRVTPDFRTYRCNAPTDAVGHNRTHALHQTAPEAATALNSHLPNIAKYKVGNVNIVTQQVLRRIVAASAHLNS